MQQIIFLAAGLASLAITITMADLLFSLWRHRRRTATARASRPGDLFDLSDDVTAMARRESIRNRLAAIQAAGGRDETPSTPEVGLG